jgi:large exoprotein involved in heme utilization and adhesion
MKNFGRLVLLGTALGTLGFAQQWEFGGVAGGGFLNTVNVGGGSASATAGFQSGAAFGGYVGYNSYKHIGGELHYGFLQSDLKLSSGGATAKFDGVSHVVHYDVIFHTHNNNKVQLFAAVGGGMKVFRATGAEAAYQPLSQFGYFTKTQVLKPMGDFGVGVKIAISRKVFLRTEFRDYITAFPKEVITPAPGTKYGSLLHDFVPMVGLGFEM